MRSRFSRGKIGVLVLVFVLIKGQSILAFDAPTDIVVNPGATAPSTAVLRIDRRDKFTPRHLEQLRRGSAMARELLDRVANLRDTILIVRADPALARKSGLYGRTRFWVHAGELFGFVEYQAGPLNSFGTQCLIVHELAHAVEIATTDRKAGTRALRSFVLERAIGSDLGAETEFPQQVALAVLWQLQRKAAGEDSLERIALSHQITLPPITVADAMPMASTGPH